MSGSDLTYRGYSAHVEFDADDGIFVGRIADIRDVVGFHADTEDGLVTVFHTAVDDYVKACAATGKSPERPIPAK
jgi:predicted HicB family RNase H-like nuclease